MIPVGDLAQLLGKTQYRMRRIYDDLDYQTDLIDLSDPVKRAIYNKKQTQQLDRYREERIFYFHLTRLQKELLMNQPAEVLGIS